MTQSQHSDFLVIARGRGFWVSPVCKHLFPQRLMLSSDPNILEEIFFGVRGLITIATRRPRVLVLGTRTRIVLWYALLRRCGFLRNLFIITDSQYLSEKTVSAFDRIIVYSKAEIAQYSLEVQKKFTAVLYPAKTELIEVSSEIGEYIFCGGTNMRDHEHFIEAVRDLPVRVVLVLVKKPNVEIPSNCTVYGRVPLQEYINLMAGSLFVAVPLKPSTLPHGHCDISNALSVGRPVLSTRDAGIDEYIHEGVDGMLSESENTASYREVCTRLLEDRALLEKLAEGAKMKAQELTYEAFGKKIIALTH